ncbi:hypothetical protein HRR83_003783 [Exophiala dermatitidis]|uniref:Uncharacterized protein n=2 Tax=Exophiala dermatitidis TaxID=5970 RepID=H6BPB8_EXODN|nr:uncharacterized protein HMPREF1120_01762 [Exophiala dermatitidis NIH/UT8656]KAJ4518920.1 hypothetical protein HRR75_002595 [Exophiala dermatitidis]EHY53573.1 hypothetical protein HMPREF1120_01762 [Exophiala dermatitidis NIH/UT8656]KAJ4522254.1 hypothetical protein HRR74_002836 [Exophiala dermatitidis]KAJ4529580.1 hypothetical protein HRR73_000605 [Exophiala dermatitidis]KAJ4543261.1 hypothetical protein HRR77_005516 [Exophiala dermatitidis]
MFSLRKALVFSTLVLGVFSSPRHTEEDDKSLVNWEAFQALLDTIDPSSLHSVLHALAPKFQDGVFSKDRAAIEHVHSENPVIASKLVHLAKKRQVSNTTITTTSSKTASTPAQSSAEQQSSSRAASVSSILSSAIYASTVPGATTVTVAPATPTSATAVRTSDGAVVFSTIGGGLVTLTSSAVGVRFTPSTSTHLYYTTLPDGQVETSTSIVVVNAPVTEVAGASTAGSAATTTSKPGLQNDASSNKIAGPLMAVLCLGGWLLAL